MRSTSQPSDPVKFSMVFDLIDPATGNNVRTLLLETMFDGDRAYSINQGQLGAWYDLKNQTMVQPGRTYPLESIKKRAEENTQRLLADLPNMRDPQLATDTLLEAQPKLSITENPGELVITNGTTIYRIVPAPLPQNLRERFYLVSRLSDYAKAEAMHPPNASLAVTAELEKRGIYAKELTLSMHGKTTAKVHSNLGPLTGEDQRNLENARKIASTSRRDSPSMTMRKEFPMISRPRIPG